MAVRVAGSSEVLVARLSQLEGPVRARPGPESSPVPVSGAKTGLGGASFVAVVELVSVAVGAAAAGGPQW